MTNNTLENATLPAGIMNEYRYDGFTAKPTLQDYFKLVSYGALVIAYDDRKDGRRPDKYVGFLRDVSISREKVSFSVSVYMRDIPGLTTLWYDQIEVPLQGFPKAITKSGKVFQVTGLVECGGSVLVTGEDPVKPIRYTFREEDVAFMEAITFGLHTSVKAIDQD